MKAYRGLCLRRQLVRYYSCTSRQQKHNNILQSAEHQLRLVGVPDAANSSKLLWEAANGNLNQFNQFIQRRQEREPLQYIVGNWDFHDITLLVRSPVLIPRPETEELVEYVLKTILLLPGSRKKRILDIGTGTGAIGLALLKADLNDSIEFCTAIDCDERAYRLATENAANLGLSNRFHCIHTDIRNFHPEHEYDLIVSNPPYIPSGDIDTLQPEVLLYETRTALDGGGQNGDSIPKFILGRAFELLKSDGELFLELHHTHTEDVVRSWLENVADHPHPPIMQYVESKRDFAGIQRFHRLRCHNKDTRVYI